MPTETVKELMTRYRTGIAELLEAVDTTRTAMIDIGQLEGQNKGEMIANTTLAIRHLEDAAMRFGKVIQAADGGKSPLGGPATPGH